MTPPRPATPQSVRRTRSPGEGIVGVTRTLFAVALVTLQMWLLQIGMEDLLSGHTEVLWPLAAMSLVCFAFTVWLFRASKA